MKSWTKLKSRIVESSPQAKIFDSPCHNRTQIINNIVKEIEKPYRRKLAVGEKFYSLCQKRKQIINEIVTEIESRIEANFFSPIFENSPILANFFRLAITKSDT